MSDRNDYDWPDEEELVAILSAIAECAERIAALVRAAPRVSDDG